MARAGIVMAVCLWCSVPCAAQARRIVSLAPHLTELAFAAGAGERLVATVEYSDYPAAARSLPRIGDAFRVDLERLIALRPDAVLVWQSGTPAPLVERLKALRLQVVSLQTQRIADVSAAVRRIGELAGTMQVAEQAARQFDDDMGALRRQYRGRSEVRVFLQIDDAPLHTVNGRQIMSEVVELCGGRNVFAGLGALAPVIDLEAVLAVNPQVILSTDDTLADPGALWHRWPQLDAVRSANIYSVPAAHITRATTRLIVGARQACEMLDRARKRLGEPAGIQGRSAPPVAGVMAGCPIRGAPSPVSAG